MSYADEVPGSCLVLLLPENSPGEIARRVSAPGLHGVPGGLGAEGRPEVSTEVAKHLTERSREVFEGSKTLDPASVRAHVDALQGEIRSYQPWESSWFSGYDSSSIINSRLQQAVANAMIRSGFTRSGEKVSETWRPQTEAIEEVSVAGEFAKNVPGEVVDRFIYCLKHPLECLETRECDWLPSPVDWVCKHPGKALVVAGAVTGAVTGAVIFGPGILRRYLAKRATG